MLKETPKIPFYRVRDFGEKFSATFDFLKENWQLLFRLVVYLLLPLSLLQGLAVNGLMSSAPTYDSSANIVFSSDTLTFGLSYMGTLFLGIVGASLICAVCYAAIDYYNSHDDRLRTATLATLRPLVIRNFKRVLAIYVGAGVIIGLAIILLTMFTFALFNAFGGIAFLLIVVGIIALVVPVSYLAPIYLFEDGATVGGTIRRSFRLGFHSWWSAFGFLFVISLVVGIIEMILIIPFYIMTFARLMLGVGGENIADFGTPLYSFGVYLLSVIATFGNYLFSSITFTGMAYQYSSVAEDVDHLSIDADIEHFEQNGTTADKDLDNFETL